MRKRRFFYLFFLIVVLLIMGFIWVNLHHAPRDYAEIAKEGILRIAIDSNAISHYTKDDTIAGFDYELAHLLAQESGLTIEIHPEVSLYKSFQKLENQEYDIIARPLSITSEAKEKWLFASPLHLSRQVLIQRKQKYNNNTPELRNHIKLANKQIHIAAMSPAIICIKNLMQEIGDTIYIIQEKEIGNEQLFQKVALGEIDFAVCDETLAHALIESGDYKEIDINTPMSFTQQQSWALRLSSPALHDSLNIWLERIQTGNAYQNLYKRYYLGRRKWSY